MVDEFDLIVANDPGAPTKVHTEPGIRSQNKTQLTYSTFVKCPVPPSTTPTTTTTTTPTTTTTTPTTTTTTPTTTTTTPTTTTTTPTTTTTTPTTTTTTPTTTTTTPTTTTTTPTTTTTTTPTTTTTTTPTTTTTTVPTTTTTSTTTTTPVPTTTLPDCPIPTQGPPSGCTTICYASPEVRPGLQKLVSCDVDDDVLCEIYHCSDKLKAKMCPKLCGLCSPTPFPCVNKPACRKLDSLLCLAEYCNDTRSAELCPVTCGGCTIPTRACASYPCGDHGHCINMYDGNYECKCDKGYTGATCDVHESARARREISEKLNHKLSLSVLTQLSKGDQKKSYHEEPEVIASLAGVVAAVTGISALTIIAVIMIIRSKQIRN
ncbi:zonadhesin-like [Watersipora subatra]|uniref:zonadhesin-like n=1 Tax=Watersipora subatra TaxID=2589382 RepID=UPI00355C6D00